MKSCREMFLEEQDKYAQDSIYILENQCIMEQEYEEWQYQEFEQNKAIINVQPHFHLEKLPF